MALPRTLTIIVTIIAILFAIYIIGYTISMHNTQTAPYKTLSRKGPLSVRHYDELLIASTDAVGDRQAASTHAFRRLAGFIFGKNSTPTHHVPTKIAMTTPVFQQQGPQSWRMDFVMPANFTRATLPVPLEKNVQIRTIPATTYLVRRFRGRLETANLMVEKEKLLNFVKKHHVTTTGNPIFAFYNPPWTLPFMRRNEVMIAIKAPQAVIHSLSANSAN